MKTLELQKIGEVTMVTMNRPDVRNAFNPTLIDELLQVFSAPPTNILVLSGAGAVFSAGADLEWMKKSAELDRAANQRDAMRLASVFRTIDECDAVTIAQVRGAAIGGGMGLVSCCDVVIAECSDPQPLANHLNPEAVAAMARNRVIGRNNALPWYLPGDLRYFNGGSGISMR